MKKEKVYINEIPVYRTVTEDGIKYELFENNNEEGHLVMITPGLTLKQEALTVLQVIKEHAEAPINYLTIRVV